MKSRDLWLATAVLLGAAALRLVLLHDVPPGLAQDEVLNADIAIGILNGRHALFFREGWGHEPLYHYLGALYQFLLGDNVLSIRLPSVACGMLVLALSYAWVKGEFGRHVALGAAAGQALGWWPIVFGRVGIRPISEPLVLLVAMIALQRGLKTGRRSGRWFALAGAALGLTFYTYTAARVVPFILLLYLPYLALVRSRPVAGRWRQVWLLVLIATLVAAPLLITLLAHPELEERVDQLSGPLDALRKGDLVPVTAAVLRTLGIFGVTGDPRWTYSLPGRPLLDPLGAILFLAGVLVALRDWRRPAAFLALVWLGVGLVPSMVTPQSPSTIRLIGALPVVYLFPALVLGKPGRGRWQGVYLVWLAVSLAWTVRDGFVRWPAAAETRDRYQTVLLDMARHVAEGPEPAALVVADSWFDPIDRDSLNRNLGRDAGARWVQEGNALVFPRARDAWLYVPEYAPLAADLMAAARLDGAPVYRSVGVPSFAVYSLPHQPTLPLLERPVTFGGEVTLLGFQRDSPNPPAELQLLTYWRVEGALSWDLSIFLHLVGPDGTIVAQQDGLDAAVVSLQTGDAFVQRHEIILPEVLPAGPFSLQVGLYRRQATADGRLTHSGQPADYLVLLHNLTFD